MNGIENYMGFLIAGVILNLTPGADTIYILTRSVAQGRKAGIYSVFGIATGAIVYTALTAFGLSLVLTKSAMIFNIIKWSGSAYLIYLGLKLIVEKSIFFENAQLKFGDTDLLKIYGQGFCTNFLNPKIALFFMSFLPQFIRPESVNGPIPFLILGGTFILTGTTWCLFLAYSASSMTETLRENNRIGKVMQKLSGFIFIGLGLQLL